MAVRYHTDGCSYRLPQKRLTAAWLRRVAEQEGYTLAEVDYIFCSAERLLEMNRQYLGHDYFTDVITFDYSDRRGTRTVAGDIFIDVETVADNARIYGATTLQEMRRVVVHGLLRLCGQRDKTPAHRAAGCIARRTNTSDSGRPRKSDAADSPRAAPSDGATFRTACARHSRFRTRKPTRYDARLRYSGHRRRPRRLRSRFGGGAHGFTHAAPNDGHDQAGQHVVQPRRGRRSQGADRPRNRRAGRPHGAYHRPHDTPIPDAQPLEGSGHVEPARAVRQGRFSPNGGTNWKIRRTSISGRIRPQNCSSTRQGSVPA